MRVLSSSPDFQLKEDKSRSSCLHPEEVRQERLPLVLSDQHSQGVSHLPLQAYSLPMPAPVGLSWEKAGALLVF